jgi:hypothetical protein
MESEGKGFRLESALRFLEASLFYTSFADHSEALGKPSLPTATFTRNTRQRNVEGASLRVFAPFKWWPARCGVKRDS